MTDSFEATVSIDRPIELIKGFALRSARKSADGMVQSIKTVIEAE